MKFTAHIDVMPNANILDPQGKAVKTSLQSLGFSKVEEVRIGKHMVLELEAVSKEEALKQAEKACIELLANPIMESFKIQIL